MSKRLAVITQRMLTQEMDFFTEPRKEKNRESVGREAFWGPVEEEEGYVRYFGLLTVLKISQHKKKM